MNVSFGFSISVDPVSEVRQLGVNTRYIGGAADAPGDQTHHRPAAGLGLQPPVENSCYGGAP